MCNIVVDIAIVPANRKMGIAKKQFENDGLVRGLQRYSWQYAYRSTDNYVLITVHTHEYRNV